MVTRETLKQKVNEGFDFAMKSMQEQGFLYTMFDICFVDMNGKTAAAVPVLGDNEAIKQRFKIISEIGEYLGSLTNEGYIKEVLYVLTFSETWFSSESKENLESGNYVMPSKKQEKREALMVAEQSYNGLKCCEMKEIKRVIPDSKFFTLESNEIFEKVTEKFESELLDSFFKSYKETVKSGKVVDNSKLSYIKQSIIENK